MLQEHVKHSRTFGIHGNVSELTAQSTSIPFSASLRIGKAKPKLIRTGYIFASPYSCTTTSTLQPYIASLAATIQPPTWILTISYPLSKTSLMRKFTKTWNVFCVLDAQVISTSTVREQTSSSTENMAITYPYE